MPNRNYERGVAKERKLVNKARAEGCIAFRSAGSHSPIDVCIINHGKRIIEFIQCKSEKGKKGINPHLKEKLEAELSYLIGTYRVFFRAA